MACTPSELTTAARCWCLGNRQMELAIALRLLCALRDGEIMSCDPATLAADAACIACGIPENLMVPAMLPVLCDILAAGGGGAGTTQVYENRDPLPPDDPTKAALNFPTGGGTLTQWSIASQVWV